MNGAAIAHEQRTSTWQTEPNRAPALQEHDELIYDEHGRIVYWTEERKPGEGVDSRSHWFRIVRQYGRHYLLVRHGAGDERIGMYTWGNFRDMIEPLSSDARYSLMHHLYSMHKDAERQAQAVVHNTYRTAFAQGRLKKRKVRDGVKVWIEDAA